MKGRMEVEVKPTEQEVEVVPDSTAGSRTGASGPVPAPQSGKTAAASVGQPMPEPAVKPAVAPVPARRPVRKDAPGRPAPAGEPAEARPRTEQQQMKPVDLKLDDDEIQSTQ